MPRKRSTKKSNKRHYFTQVHEDAIIQYARTECIKERTRRYIDYIQPAFDEMVDKITYNQYEVRREKEEFWVSFYQEVDSWDTGTLKANEHKVLQAIKILFESSDDIEIFNKKAVYLYMREITGLNTKQIVNSLNKMRIRYRDFKKKWNGGEI